MDKRDDIACHQSLMLMAVILAELAMLGHIMSVTASRIGRGARRAFAARRP